MMSYVMVVKNHRQNLFHFFYKKQTEKYFGTKLTFRPYATFFGPTILDQVSNKNFYVLIPCQSWTKMEESSHSHLLQNSLVHTL